MKQKTRNDSYRVVDIMKSFRILSEVKNLLESLQSSLKNLKIPIDFNKETLKIIEEEDYIVISNREKSEIEKSVEKKIGWVNWYLRPISKGEDKKSIAKNFWNNLLSEIKNLVEDPLLEGFASETKNILGNIMSEGLTGSTVLITGSTVLIIELDD